MIPSCRLISIKGQKVQKQLPLLVPKSVHCFLRSSGIYLQNCFLCWLLRELIAFLPSLSRLIRGYCKLVTGLNGTMEFSWKEEHVSEFTWPLMVPIHWHWQLQLDNKAKIESTDIGISRTSTLRLKVQFRCGCLSSMTSRLQASSDQLLNVNV